MYLFMAADLRRVAAGEITVTYRLWKTPHVKAGRTYASEFGGSLVIEDVRIVRAGDILGSDLSRTGCPNLESVMALAGEHTRSIVTLDTPLYRVQLHYEQQAPPSRPHLDLDEVRKRLDRLDAASARGPWTESTLRLIAENPRVVARLLARELDWQDLLDFKQHVRRLKALGLTISHPVGYELSELGQAYLDALDAG